jgi:alpha-L-fucosidase
MITTKKTALLTAASFFFGMVGAMAFSQERSGSAQSGSYAIVRPGDSMEEIVRKAATVVPSPRQSQWQEQEFIAFIHFTMNTFTDREWGLGTESPSLFDPTALDARQWVKVIRDAGMRMVIVTAKHHDGLCLWPSKYTEHSVKNTPWRNGKGDVVGEVAAACREFGLKFGVYLSPWDRHEPTYGDSPKYNEFFRNQLRELLGTYGEISEVWFDGACGEGPNGKRQVYDWSSYYRLIRELQPGAVIAIMGPDVRWVGTESGYGRDTEWSVLPDVVQHLDAIAAGSQQNPVDGAFVPGDVMGEDLGSRDKIRSAKALVWYPAETDVSIRPGWFYHASQDDRVKTPEKLVDIYYSSVGKNSVLLLNIPPDKRGLIHDNDIKSLMGMRRILDQTFRVNLLSSAHVTATNEKVGHRALSVIDKDKASYWTTDDGVESATLEFVLPQEETFDRAMLQEHIRAGQRVEEFRMDAHNGKKWVPLTQGTTIGYKRLLRFPAVTAKKVRLVIEKSRTSPTLSAVGLFKAPPRAIAVPDGGSFEDSVQVRLVCDTKGASIYYTLDGTEPISKSERYTRPIVLTRSTTLKASAAVAGDEPVQSLDTRYLKCLKVRGVKFEKPCSPKYPGAGPLTVINGKRGMPDFHEGEWLGFEGDDVGATLDLGEVRTIRAITAGFLQEQGAWIFLPTKVVFAASDDGVNWTPLAEQTSPVEQSERVLVKDFEHVSDTLRARYIRVSATNIGVCPSWHSGAGTKAWVFMDEIIVR